jgi:hypothetical protein
MIEKWHKLHTWSVHIPYFDHTGGFSMATLRLSSREGRVSDNDIAWAVRNWGENLGMNISAEELQVIGESGRHGFA